MVLYVGSENMRFDIHQHQLFEVSTFFKAAFTSQYEESSEKSMDLLEDDVDTFELIVQWLYTKECHIWNNDGEELDDDGDYFMQAVRLLVFADKYDSKLE